MKQEKIITLLRAFGQHQTGYRSGWVETHCLLAPWRHASGRDAHPSFAIKAEDKKKSICKCLSCGFGGDLIDLIYYLKSKNRGNGSLPSNYRLQLAAQIVNSEFEDLEFDPHSLPEYGDQVEAKEFPFPEEWLATFPKFHLFPEAIAYLKKRGVSQGMARHLDVRFDPIARRVGFPFRNFKGQLMGVQGRALDDNASLRYYQYGFQSRRNLGSWMSEDRLDLDRPLILVEGPFDLCSVLRLYPNVAASFTSGLSVEKIKRISDASFVVTFYDYGKGGDAARKKIKEVLKNTPVIDVIPTQEQDDAGAMSTDEVADALNEHVNLSFYK